MPNVDSFSSEEIKSVVTSLPVQDLNKDVNGEIHAEMEDDLEDFSPGKFILLIINVWTLKFYKFSCPSYS